MRADIDHKIDAIILKKVGEIHPLDGGMHGLRLGDDQAVRSRQSLDEPFYTSHDWHDPVPRHALP